MKRFFKYLLIAIVSIIIIFTAFFFLAPGTVLNLTMKSKLWSAGISTKQIQAGKHNWHYYEGGEKNPQTMILLHGYGANKFFWINELEHYKKTYHVISPDLPSFGDNQMVESENYAIDSQVRFLNEFIEALKLSQVDLMGISMGGLISAAYTSSHPDKVKKLILLDSGGLASPVPTEFWVHFRKTRQNLIDYDTVEGFDKMLSIVFQNPQKVPTVIKKYFVAEKKKRYKNESKVFNDLVVKGENVLQGRLEKITSPTLIIWGEKDQIFNVATAELFHKKIKNSKLVVIPNSGHASIVDTPKEAYAAIDNFLGSVK